MSILNEGVADLISRFGETVTIIPTAGYETTDDIWHSDGGYQDEQAFEEKARVFRAVSNEDLREEGFSDEGECMLYFNDVTVGQGDLIQFDDYEWIVNETRTNQIGNGVYRQSCSVRTSER